MSRLESRREDVVAATWSTNTRAKSSEAGCVQVLDRVCGGCHSSRHARTMFAGWVLTTAWPSTITSSMSIAVRWSCWRRATRSSISCRRGERTCEIRWTAPPAPSSQTLLRAPGNSVGRRKRSRSLHAVSARSARSCSALSRLTQSPDRATPGIRKRTALTTDGHVGGHGHACGHGESNTADADGTWLAVRHILAPDVDHGTRAVDRSASPQA